VHSQNFAARVGRWSAAHWKAATGIWIVFVVLAVLVGSAAGTVKLTDAEQSTGETARAEAILSGAGFKTPASEVVLIESARVSASSSAFRSTVRAVVRRLRSLPQVTNVHTGAPGDVARNGHAQLVHFDMRGDAKKALDRVKPVLEAVAQLQRAHPGFTIAEFGDASAAYELNKTIGQDFRKAERLAVPITFLILLWAFGAFVAAAVPVLLAFSAVLASIGLAQVFSHVAHASDSTQSVILLMGMAVGVDYSLFYLKREREERAAGHEGHEALFRASATSGQAVLISGLTVLIAMAGMLFAGSKIFVSIGVGAMIVVFTALIGSLTVLPALLGKLGDRVEWGIRQALAALLLSALRPFKVQPRRLVWLRDTPTLLRRLKGNRQESRVWGFVLRGALSFPGIATLLCTAILIILALPVFSMHTKLLGFTDLPKDIQIVRTYDRIQAAFPGSAMPAHLVVKAPNVTAPRFQAAYRAFVRRALASGEVTRPITVSVNRQHTVARVDFPLAGNGTDAAAVRALKTLRERVIPPVLKTLPKSTEVAVTGMTAATYDFNQTMKRRAPLVFAFVLGLAFLLLLLTFRSIVIPLKAILLNLLSVGAAFGLLVWIFQDGHLEGLLNFHSNGAVVTWLPLFLFTVLFGLSMDYHVFILSRVKELVDHGVPTVEAVERAIRTTASTVTSAAAVMVAVFAIFASLRSLDIKQLGVGLALAVLLDATLIRGVLLPAAMKLLGPWNWYLPPWLDWVPRLNVEAELHEAMPESNLVRDERTAA
jgi:uncharacterized membrane protein YdfJ with MMPL/SSD domain